MKKYIKTNRVYTLRKYRWVYCNCPFYRTL